MLINDGRDIDTRSPFPLKQEGLSQRVVCISNKRRSNYTQKSANTKRPALLSVIPENAACGNSAPGNLDKDEISG